MNITAFDLAKRFIGMKEVPGEMSNPQILAMLQIDEKWPKDDAVPWCSAFVNYIAWLLNLPRSKSLGARSWLNIGQPIDIQDVQSGFDVVILKRGKALFPDDEINAPGHVGLFAGLEGDNILLLGGNQSDAINITAFPVSKVIGIRRLYEEA